MRSEPNLRIEVYRRSHPHMGSSTPGASWGYFEIGPLRVISSGAVDGNPVGAGWEHVSVSCTARTPTWGEMKSVKELFWEDEECVVQFHPPASLYVSKCATCLHLWRKPGASIELPPKVLIA